MAIEVTGEWQQQRQQQQQPAAAPGRAQSAAAAAARPAQPPGFVAASIRASRATAAAPRAVTVAAGAGGGVVAAAAAAGGAAAQPAAATVVLSYHQPVTSTLTAVFIPIVAAVADGSGAACPGTAPPRVAMEEVKKAVFAEASPGAPTVGSTFNQCSYGKTRLTTASSAVLEPVQLPCNGTSYGVPWSFEKCDFDDFNGWADVADAELARRGVDLSQYKHRVYLLPPSACAFVGLAYIGCDGSYDCRSWLAADYWAIPQAIAHELGHNLFMAHAGSSDTGGGFDEYGDSAGLMGSCCSPRCPNTPHAWQLGWIAPRLLDGGSLPAGQTLEVSLASQAATPRSGLRIVPSWAAGVDPIFVGYRTRARGDVGLAPEAARRVHIHTAAIANPYDARVTVWRAALGGGADVWEHPASGLVVRLVGAGPSAAAITVCRKGGAETVASCAAGRDNDCNGLVGAGDPACAALLRKRHPRHTPLGKLPRGRRL